MITQTDIHIGDIGTTFLVTITDSGVVVDLSSGSSPNHIVFRKPSGKIVSHIGVFDTDGTDGKIKFVTTNENDLDEQGIWKIGSIVNTISGTWTATAVPFAVKSVFS